MKKHIFHWLKNGSSCDNCKWMWDETISNENGTEYDCGCHIKGCNYDETRCYLINPFKYIIGSFQKRKLNYCIAHEYDDFEDWYKKDMAKTDKMSDLIQEHIIQDGCLGWKKENGEFIEWNTKSIVRENAYKLMDDYESSFHPKNTSLSSEWKTLIKKTGDRFYHKTIGKIKPYVCK